LDPSVANSRIVTPMLTDIASTAAIGATAAWPDDRLSHHDGLPVERRGRGPVQNIAKVERCTNPTAERSVVRTGKESISRQIVRRRRALFARCHWSSSKRGDTWSRCALATAEAVEHLAAQPVRERRLGEFSHPTPCTTGSARGAAYFGRDPPGRGLGVCGRATGLSWDDTTFHSP
jgi:hypothetical protein